MVLRIERVLETLTRLFFIILLNFEYLGLNERNERNSNVQSSIKWRKDGAASSVFKITVVISPIMKSRLSRLCRNKSQKPQGICGKVYISQKSFYRTIKVQTTKLQEIVTFRRPVKSSRATVSLTAITMFRFIII